MSSQDAEGRQTIADIRNAYTGRKWIVAARRTSLRPFIDWGLRQPSAHRAMVLPFIASLLCTVLALYLALISAAGLLEPVIGLGLTLFVFWPLGLVCALGTDLMKKEHRFQRSLRDVGGRWNKTSTREL